MSDTPKTDHFSLEKMYQASAGVLAEDDAVSQLLDFARTLERQNAKLLEALKEIAKGYSGVAGRNLQSYSKIDCQEIARAAIAKAES